MSLLPEIERELLRAARRPLAEDEQPRRRGPAISATKRLRITAGDALAAVSVLASLALAGLVLVLLHHSTPRSVTSTAVTGAFPGAPHSQLGAWRQGGDACPLARPNAYLPRRVGCVTVARADVNGDGRADLILLYGRLSNQRTVGGFGPTGFTLKVVRDNGGVFTAGIRNPQEPPTILLTGNDNGRPGAEIFIHETHISSGELVGVYAFDGHHLKRAGGLWYGGDAALHYGFTCRRGQSARIIQHEFLLLKGPIATGVWQRTDTTYLWAGATLRLAARHTTKRHGIPPLSLTGLGVDCGKLLDRKLLPRL